MNQFTSMRGDSKGELRAPLWSPFVRVSRTGEIKSTSPSDTGMCLSAFKMETPSLNLAQAASGDVATDHATTKLCSFYNRLDPG